MRTCYVNVLIRHVSPLAEEKGETMSFSTDPYLPFTNNRVVSSNNEVCRPCVHHSTGRNEHSSPSRFVVGTHVIRGPV